MHIAKADWLFCALIFQFCIFIDFHSVLKIPYSNWISNPTQLMAMLVEHKSTVFEISSFTEEIQISLLEDQCHIWFGGHWTGVSWRRTKTVYFLYCFICWHVWLFHDKTEHKILCTSFIYTRNINMPRLPGGYRAMVQSLD